MESMINKIHLFYMHGLFILQHQLLTAHPIQALVLQIKWSLSQQHANTDYNIKFILLTINSFVSSAFKYEAKRIFLYTIELISRLSFFNWTIKRLPTRNKSYNTFMYIGRRNKQAMASLIMGFLPQTDSINQNEQAANSRVVVSELPMPGAICVPNFLNTILPIDRSLEQLFENIGHDKLKFFLKHREKFSTRLITDNLEIETLNETMFKPFSKHRYGEWAIHYKSSKIQQIVRNQGVLNLIHQNDQVVSCSLSSELIYHGKRYWRGERSGFTEAVFSNSKHFSDINTMSYLLEIEWASKQNYDFYEMGVSLASPEDNVIQWKRRLRGQLNTMGNQTFFYVYPPQNNLSEYFWEKPLFGLESGNITLHLGMPSSQTEQDFIKRIRPMGFGGLSTIYLHCNELPSDDVLNAIANLYEHFKTKPTIQIKIV